MGTGRTNSSASLSWEKGRLRKRDHRDTMNIIAACIKCGAEVEIVCDGEHEQEALSEAVAMIESGLGE